MEMAFSADDLRFRDEVRAFLAQALTDDLRHAVRNMPGVFMGEELYRRWHSVLNDRGWLGYAWPSAFGGTGWSPVRRYIFERECALAGAPQIAVQGVRLLAPVLQTFGTQAQKDYFLPRILSGEHVWCQGYSEPESGSDLASLRTKAVREGDHYVVNGTKIWTTNAHFSNWIFCLVRTDSTVKPQAGISFLLIDMKTPGISVTPIRAMSGDHDFNQVFFDNVRVPVTNRIGEEGQGWTIAKFLLEHERGGSCHAPGLLADLARLRRIAARQPMGGGGMLSDDQDYMRRLAALEMEAEAMEMFELRMLADLANKRTLGPETSLVALLMSRLRKGIDRLMLEAYGYDGLQFEPQRPLYRDDLSPVGSEDARVAMPTYLNDLAWSIMGGSDEVMRTIIAKTVLKL